MKPTRTFSLIIALLTIMGLQTAFAQNRGRTGKSGNSTITKNFNVGSFSAIETDIVGNIFFTQSDETSVTAEGDENLVNRLIVTVKAVSYTHLVREGAAAVQKRPGGAAGG